MLRSSCFTLVAVLLPTTSLFAQSTLDQIGVIELRNRLGAAAPSGAGVSVMQVEALDLPNGPNAYMPLLSDPNYIGKTFTDESVGGTFSGHANGVGRFFYGTGFGVGSGITDIHNYKVVGDNSPGDWFFATYLNAGGGAPVARPDLRVQNHSWVGPEGFNSTLQELSRRYDFALRRDNVLGVVGVNNGAGSPIPSLLGNSYNSIAVGLTNANNSWGPSTADVPGRSKPDIVAPENATSFSTPQVAGAAAILVQTADQLGGGNAGRIETIKSALLSGATKDEFRTFVQPWTRTNNGTFVEPLDRRVGAGELNVNNSHLILTAGEKNGTDQVLDGQRGWDFETMTGAGAVRRYFFDVGSGENIRFTATANWLRRITPTGAGANAFATSTATLSTVELRLFEANPDFSLGTLVDSSISPIDNVQHLFEFNLPGNHRYALQVTLAGLPGGQASEDVAVAWFTDLSVVPEPSTYVLIGLAGALGVAWEIRRRNRQRIELDTASGVVAFE